MLSGTVRAYTVTPGQNGRMRHTATFASGGGVQPVGAGTTISAGLNSALAINQFTELAAGLPHVASFEVECDSTYDDILDCLGQLGTIHMASESTACYIVAKLKSGAVAYLTAYLSWGDWDVTVAAKTLAGARRAARALAKILPARPYATEDAIDCMFWTYDPMMGGVYNRRDIDRLTWSDIEGNYPPSIRTELAKLSALTGPPTDGRLMVFSGPPGTGKTRMLQSLADSWSDWADLHYVVDPDTMLSTASYLTRVLLGTGDDSRWRLVVIEDGDEFIDKDAKARSGHSIARLLNIADGLVGQGLKVMVLVSTNVESTKFSEAVVRTGRCGANVVFPPFTADEAGEWAKANKVSLPDGMGAATLAELYALLR